MILAATVSLIVLLLASQTWRWASPASLMLLLASAGALLALQKPQLGLIGLVLTALLVNREFGTGTEVNLNPTTLLVPVLFILWLLDVVRRRDISLTNSRTTRPLVLFLLAALLSLLIGRATWDPAVPTRSNFLLVQLAQWAIFAFSAVAFWLAANLLHEETWLRRLTQALLLVGGVLAIAIAVLGVGRVVGSISTLATFRTPFWVLLTGLAGGQLLFNKRVSASWRLYLVVVLLAILVYAFRLQQEATSNWVGVASVVGVLVWLRWPRLRWPIVAAIVVLGLIGVLFPSIYDFAGGDVEWQRSGGSRLVLSERVIDVTMRNPITGLGPAAYRPYANMTPL
ncbi:MAG: O-antigen ligase family protein, partial [Caldilineaceae bacterium]|nr:O-antigen ligase family protein [Caldilineaceae bacterium]